MRVPPSLWECFDRIHTIFGTYKTYCVHKQIQKRFIKFFIVKSEDTSSFTDAMLEYEICYILLILDLIISSLFTSIFKNNY